MTGRVVVVGSANVDRTIILDRVPDRGETVLGGAASLGPGGKGLNQAVAAARVGAPTAFVGAVGADRDGDLLMDTLAGEGIDTDGVLRVDEPTGLAIILLEPEGTNRIVVSPGANQHCEPDLAAVGPGDVVVVQLEIPRPAVAAALTAGREAGALTILNAAPAQTDLDDVLPLVDVLVVNEPELAALTDASVEEADGPELRQLALPVRQALVVTQGASGASVVDRRKTAVTTVGQVPAPEVEVVDTTGAGDCFVGVLAAALRQGTDLRLAVGVAVHAASLSVGRSGASPSMPRLEELPPDLVAGLGS
jgi:ribokinase